MECLYTELEKRYKDSRGSDKEEFKEKSRGY